MRSVAAVLALAVALVGCDDGVHDLLVEVKTDFVPGVEFSRIEVSLGEEVVTDDAVGLGDADYQDGRRVATIGPLMPDPMRLVVVRLINDAGRTVAERHAIVDHGSDLSIRLLLTRSCRDAGCDYDDGETCHAGRCVEASCVEGTETSCGEAECALDADCTELLTCTDGQCVDGACLYVQRSDACGADEFCNPEGDCQAVPPLCERGCDDGNACSDDTCVDGFGCRNAYNGSCPSPCLSQTQIPAAECAALEALWSSTEGPSWSQTDGWLLTNEPCFWKGLDCDDAGGSNIADVVLRENNLSGPLPVELADLTLLQVLDLRENALSGPVPVELTTLSELRVMHFYRNQLSGTIPPELARLTNLEVLWLRSNQMTGPIPPELGLLINLQDLQISSNMLDGPIPPELGNLTALTSLHLHTNQLTGPIPRELTALTAMREIYFDANMLEGVIPAGFETWTDVTTFRLYDNGCFTAETPELAAWLDGIDGRWDEGCP